LKKLNYDDYILPGLLTKILH